MLPSLAADEWALGFAISIKVTNPTNLSAVVKLKDGTAIASSRLNLVNEDTCAERSWLGLATGAIQLEPNAGASHHPPAYCPVVLRAVHVSVVRRIIHSPSSQGRYVS